MKSRYLMLMFAALVVVACGQEQAEDAHTHGEDETGSWAVTAWGEHFGLFPEFEGLVAGQTGGCHFHVTVLDGFTPAAEGSVTIVLREPSGREERFASTEVVRPGIFLVDVWPKDIGERELTFEIEIDGVRETIAGGTVHVGTAEEPGGLVVAPFDPPSGGGGEAVDFLLEQQWSTGFASEWVNSGSLHASVAGTARIEPPSGGEVLLTAPADGVVRAATWPYTGQKVAPGATLLTLIPIANTQRSLAELEASVSEIEALNEAAVARAQRLDDLLEREAVSRREVEHARAEATGLGARLEAARADLEAAEAGRTGRQGVTGLGIASPFVGRVAEVVVSPGEHVSAGTALLRLVRERPVWARVALTPGDAGRLSDRVAGLVLDIGASSDSLEVSEDELRLVSVAPEVDPLTGTVEALIEISKSVDELRPGSVATALILLPDLIGGVVLPDSAVVDDAGEAVVYVQFDGESFLRREVEVRRRQGNELLVEGVLPGERVVTRGGAAIRRASLMASGEAQGHVH
jgi:cobalt-zinc-cadmium efflux system membrane fusion protein